MITDIDAAYAAGFFDGEGAVMIWRRTGERVDTAGRRYHRLVTRVRQVDRRPLDWLQARFGGSVQQAILPKAATGWRPSWDWCLSNRLAVEFLQRVRPFLVLKRDRVDVALRFQATMGLNVTVGRKGWTAITPELWEQREQLRAELMRLNHRGTSSPLHC